MEDVSHLSMGSDSDYSITWISWFLSLKRHEYFCEVDEDFILDRFNLTGLNTEVPNYAQALKLITDQLDDDESWESLNVQAGLLYGLIHARWIVTAGGLAKMVEKYKRGDFGRCPRVLCHSHSLLPVGLTDTPFEKTVKVYCGRCEDLYSPKSSRHGSLDGAYFGTTFPHLLYLVYPTLLPPKVGPPDRAASVVVSKRHGLQGWERLLDARGGPGQGSGGETRTTSVTLGLERYRPRIYGFQVHETAKLQRWQEAMRDRQTARPEEPEEC
ncbi:casein kinase II, regulatory subunit [Mycena leptocephala]|nr:casein kinase II, regulatory subunit [Mycena leptocephala]